MPGFHSREACNSLSRASGDWLPLQKQRYCRYGLRVENELSLGKYGAIIVTVIRIPMKGSNVANAESGSSAAFAAETSRVAQ